MPRLARTLPAILVSMLVPAFSGAQTTNAGVGFGAVAVGAASAPATLTFNVPSSATFSLSYGTEFVVSPANCSGNVCSVPVVFQPALPGLRRGAVSAFQGTTLLAVTPVFGTGASPKIGVGPGLISTVASRTNGTLASATLFGVAARDANQVYVADSAKHQIDLIDRRTGRVSVVAGNGTPGFSGDGALGVNAQLYQPSGLAIDPSGNLIIADTNNQRIRLLNLTTGIISTLAGNGATGSGGDTGPATAASFNSPSAVAVNASGDIYITDTLNSVVRVISATTGIISRFAGTTLVAGSIGDGGAATSAQLNGPVGIAVDGNGNVFVADVLNNVVREISGGIISRVAGQIGPTGGYAGDGGAAVNAALSFPYGVAVDAAGDLYIADDRNSVIRKVTGDSSHIITTIAGSSIGYAGDGGSATTARLNGPASLALDPSGNLYLIDSGNSALRVVSADPVPLTFPLTGVGSSAGSVITLSNTGNQALTVSASNFPANFSAGSGGTCSVTPTLQSGQSCTLALSFTPTSGGSTSGSLAFVSNTLNNSSSQQPVVLSESNGLYFVPVAPCRVADTRLAAGTFGAPFLSGGASRDYPIRNSNFCPGTIPGSANVQAYSLNVTVIPHGSLSFLTVYPSAASRPGVSTLNAYDGRTKANAVIVPANTSDVNRAISVYASNDTELIIDINGYYVPESVAGALAFFPLPPCRVADTREAGRPANLGTPAMAAGETRNFPLLSGSCNLPSVAQAYALNFTAIPAAPLSYLTTWPAGQTQPVVSTLNATTAAVTANAAIVPAGASGNISVFTTAAANLIIDVSGYYAPAATGGLALYNVAPCRAYDTRTVGSGLPMTGVVNEDVRTTCSVPVVAQSFVLNTTVLPVASLSYLTMWAHGSGQPVQSTLNAYDGATTSNLAVVPSTDGLVSSFVTANTGLILDLFGYFAP